MDESTLPPSPNWFLSNILACREDGSLAYGSKNHLVILKTISNTILDTIIITNAHNLRVTSVAFSPVVCSENFKNTVVSCSEDGFVKLWKIDTLTAFIGHESHWKEKKLSGKVNCLDWSVANPHHVISAADNNSIVLWNILSNTTVKFTFPKILAVVLACCPHSERVIAVGTKSGLVFVISLVKSGEIIHKFRGHDNEIQSLSWCPMPYNVFNVDEIYEEFLLASSCQNKEIFIWRAGSDGKCEISIQIPTSSLSKKDCNQFPGKLGNTFSYLSLFWHSAYKLYLTSNFGELLFFDINFYLDKFSKTSVLKLNKASQNCFKIAHNFHSKGLYAISSKTLFGNIITYTDLEIKSEIKFKIDVKTEIIKNLKNENIEKRKWKINEPKPDCLLWTAGQDRRLVASKFKESNLEIIFNLGTLNGGVFAIALSPHDPNRIAIGSGDGLIRLWNLLEPSGEMQLFWQKIKDRVTSLAWHPTKDGLLAYGTSEGRVGLIDTIANKLPTVFTPSHSHTIYSLSWGPQCPISDENNFRKELNLYCVGDNTLSLFNVSDTKRDPLNLTKLMPFPCKKQSFVSWKPDYSLMAVGCDDGTIYLVEAKDFKIISMLFTFKKTIYSIAWHPVATSFSLDLSPYHTYFAAGSTDNKNVIYVFSCKEKEKNFEVEEVASLKGHYDHVICVAWCTHFDCKLVSTSADGSVQIWDVIAQAPLVNFSPIQKPNLSIWSPIDPDIILTGCHNGVLSIWKISKQKKTLPSPIQKIKKTKKAKEISLTAAKEITLDITPAPIEIVEPFSSSIIVAESKNTENNVKETKVFSKAWKSDSNQNCDRCYFLLKTRQESDDCLEDLQFSLPFLENGKKYLELAALEEKRLKSSNNWTEYYELSLWNGKIKEVIEEQMKSGHLNDFLVSLAPTVSFHLWQEACLSYSKTLIEKKMFHKAATYLIGCHKIYEAIDVLVDENLFLEALYIARSRLPKSDPVFVEIIQQYAQWLFETGSFLKACECYIYLKDYMQVARICGKKSEPEYLSLAALAARKCGLENLEITEATNALLRCLELLNFELGQRICNDHDNLTHLKLIFHMYETIYKLDKEELELTSEDVLDHVRKLIDLKTISFPSSLPLFYQHHRVYKNKQEMLIVVAQELSLAICNRDENEKELTHIIKALCTCCRYVHISDSETDFLFKLCSWLFLIQNVSLENCFKIDKQVLPAKVESLKEFVGAAIVRHLNSHPSAENVSPWLSSLKELENYFLNENSFRYFKNLVEVGICEKRLMSSQGSSIRKNLEAKGDENCKVENDSNPITLDEKTSENGQFNSSFTCEPSNNIKYDEASDENFQNDKDLLHKLKNEISHFQNTKVSAPNPMPVYFMLKKLCGIVPESTDAQTLASNLESKWLKLNTLD